MKKHLFGLSAVVLAIAFTAFTSSNSKVDRKDYFTDRYFEFVGSPGQEDNESLWDEISQQDFDNSPCNASINGCVIKAVSTTPAAPFRPDDVTVTGSGPSMTPIATSGKVLAVKNLHN